MASAILWIWLFSKYTTLKIILVKSLKELESSCSIFEYGQLHTVQSFFLEVSSCKKVEDSNERYLLQRL